MIYQKYNFSNSFSNASGRGRERMALSELARLIRNYPLVVKDILESSDIKVPRNITKKDTHRLTHPRIRSPWQDLLSQLVFTLL